MASWRCNELPLPFDSHRMPHDTGRMPRHHGTCVSMATALVSERHAEVWVANRRRRPGGDFSDRVAPASSGHDRGHGARRKQCCFDRRRCRATRDRSSSTAWLWPKRSPARAERRPTIVPRGAGAQRPIPHDDRPADWNLQPARLALVPRGPRTTTPLQNEIDVNSPCTASARSASLSLARRRFVLSAPTALNVPALTTILRMVRCLSIDLVACSDECAVPAQDLPVHPCPLGTDQE